VAGADALVTGFSVEELASAVEAPVGATAAPAGAIVTPPRTLEEEEERLF
jgi:hypothetical protein